jgi:hypothetical protein
MAKSSERRRANVRIHPHRFSLPFSGSYSKLNASLKIMGIADSRRGLFEMCLA